MPKYRKKPVVIEAVQWTGRNIAEIEAFMSEEIWAWADGRLAVRTLEGLVTARTGDFIIKGVRGEFYPCKPDIFEQTYEAVTE